MELKIKIDYNQILKLIHQLPEQDINKLIVTLNSKKTLKKTSKLIQDLIITAPTWTDSDLNNYTDSRNHFNKSGIHSVKFLT
ncbi:MAG: hypothetical protein PF484_00310 [Bacteroidales bacterium]|jgi:hypothetical protein|nr:hypothetical protein [Bacteroidales bacterium]